MQALESQQPPQLNERFMITNNRLRRWASPGIILVVTDLRDEKSIQFHAIQQARQSKAKLLLVQVDRSGSTAVARTQHLYGALSQARPNLVPRDTAERMITCFRGSGIPCESIVVRSLQPRDIPSIVTSCCADRVLVSAPADQSDSIAQEIINGVRVPVCVVSRTMTVMSRYQRPARRVTLMLSAHAKTELPIAFASRFAHEIHSQLTIMNVCPRGPKKLGKNQPLVTSLASQLQSAALRKAELICPVEIVVREGDPSTELLEYDSCCNQDFVILAPQCELKPTDFDMSAVRTVIEKASCPILIVPGQLGWPDTEGTFRGKTPPPRAIETTYCLSPNL